MLDFVAVGTERMKSRCRDNINVFVSQPGEKLLIVDVDRMDEDITAGNPAYLLPAVDPEKRLRQK